MNKLLYGLAVLILLLSCKKDRPEEENEFVITSSGRGVMIGSEGNFQFGNASISLYDYDSESISEEVFKNTNGYQLGDVLQSMCEVNNSLYLVLNNSSKIEVVDKRNFKSIGRISGLGTPRYFLPVSNNKAYVSDLYSNCINIVNLNSLSVEDTIQTRGWTEEMVLLYGKAFVCNKGNNLLYIIDTRTDEIIDSVLVGKSPSSIREDKEGNLWVLCQGVSGEPNQYGGLYKVNPLSLEIEIIFNFNGGSHVSNLNINGSNDTLYYLCNGAVKGVCRMAINDLTLPSVPFISSGDGVNFYGLGIDPSNGRVLVSDAIDYVQKSKVSVYDQQGQLLTSFSGGINTSSFLFFD